MFKTNLTNTPREEGIYRVVEEFETDHLIFLPGEEAIVEKDDYGNWLIFRPGVLREYGDPLPPCLWGKIKMIRQLVN